MRLECRVGRKTPEPCEQRHQQAPPRSAAIERASPWNAAAHGGMVHAYRVGKTITTDDRIQADESCRVRNPEATRQSRTACAAITRRASIGRSLISRPRTGRAQRRCGCDPHLRDRCLARRRDRTPAGQRARHRDVLGGPRAHRLGGGERPRHHVTNTPDVLTEATADIAMLCLLGAARRVRGRGPDPHRSLGRIAPPPSCSGWNYPAPAPPHRRHGPDRSSCGPARPRLRHAHSLLQPSVSAARLREQGATFHRTLESLLPGMSLPEPAARRRRKPPA